MMAGKEARSAFLLYLICISTFFASLMQNMYSPILPLLRDSFGVSLSMVNLSVSLFIFIVAVLQIVIGSVIDVKGTRIVLIPGLVLTIAASIGCAVTDDFAVFLICRALQAFGTAAIPLIAATTIGRLFQGSQRGSAMGTYQMLLSVAPAAAPVLGGWIGERYSYPVFSGSWQACLSSCWPRTESIFRETRGQMGRRFACATYLLNTPVL